jgi:hypothetical protein
MHGAPQASALAVGRLCASSGTRPPCININITAIQCVAGQDNSCGTRIYICFFYITNIYFPLSDMAVRSCVVHSTPFTPSTMDVAIEPACQAAPLP